MAATKTAASVVVLLILTSFGCGREVAKGAEAGARPDERARAAFVTRADQICDRFRTSSRSLAGEVGGSGSFGGMAPHEAIAFYRLLLPLADAYLRSVAALDAPPAVRGFANSLMTDAYETWLLLEQVESAAAGTDEAVLRRTTGEVLAHLQGKTGFEGEMDAYGFAVCGERDWLLLLQIEGALGDADAAVWPSS